MSEKDIFIILVDANKERVQALAAKLKPFGYSVQVCSTLEDSLNVLKNTTAQLIIIEQSVFDNYHANYKAQLKKMNLENTALYMLKTAKTCELKKYFAKGVVGYFENSLDARTLMNGIRKSLLPQQLQ